MEMIHGTIHTTYMGVWRIGVMDRLEQRLKLSETWAVARSADPERLHIYGAIGGYMFVASFAGLQSTPCNLRD